MKVMQAQKKMDMKKLLEQEKMELHHQIKRRIALETIVSALEVRAINGYGIYVRIYAWGGGGGYASVSCCTRIVVLVVCYLVMYVHTYSLCFSGRGA